MIDTPSEATADAQDKSISSGGQGEAGGEHDILKAIGAEHVVEEPGDPESDEPASPASDADAPAPPG